MTDPAILAAANKIKTDVDALVALTNKPVPPPPPPARKLRVGLNNVGSRTWIQGCTEAMVAAGVRWDRCDAGDFFIVQANHAKGVATLPVMTGLAGRSSAQCAADTVALAKAILPLGLTEIEFGNEVYFNGSFPTEYAAQYKAAHAALAGMGVTLIANAYGDYQRRDGSWSQCTNNGGWTVDLINANPGKIDAFSVHPYGEMGVLSNDHRAGELLLPFLHDLAVQHGVDVPWYVTEVGQNLDNLGGDQNRQAACMTQYLNDLVNKTTVPGTPFSYVVSWHWYTSTDDGSGRYGIMDVNGNQYVGPRPAFTALKTWLVAHPL